MVHGIQPGRVEGSRCRASAPSGHGVVPPHVAVDAEAEKSGRPVGAQLRPGFRTGRESSSVAEDLFFVGADVGAVGVRNTFLTCKMAPAFRMQLSSARF